MKISFDKDTWNAYQMTQFYEVSRKTLAQWVRRGLPRNARGKYPLLACFHWWKKNIIGQVKGESLDIGAERLLRERARRKLEEMKAEVMAGSLVYKEESLKFFRTRVAEARQGFLILPHRLSEPLAVMTDSKEIFELLRKEIFSILNNLSQPPGGELGGK